MRNDGNKYSEKHLARRANRRSRLLDGENTATSELADILHWINVYTELLGFTSKLLAQMNDTISGMSAGAASEVRKTDVQLFARQQRRFQAQLDFWEERRKRVPVEHPNG